MPLLRKNLKTVYIFRQREDDSGYVGTKATYSPSHTEFCNIQPSTNKLMAEVYGERVFSMFTLLCSLDSNINEGDRLSFDGFSKPSHKVVSVMLYTTHKTILAEVIGVGLRSDRN